MKKKRGEQDERRRNLAEINLASAPKPRMALARRGCFSVFVMAIAVSLTLVAGLAGLR